jgi:hypothetical protein
MGPYPLGAGWSTENRKIDLDAWSSSGRRRHAQGFAFK